MTDPRPHQLIDTPTGNQDTEGHAGRKALVTGSVALGAYLAGLALRWTQRGRLTEPGGLPPALDAPVHDQELMEGRARFYRREGTGTPVVLLHSINAAASSFEMQPIFDHLARSTSRPLYALDWFGFGLSDRPPVQYRSELYQRQLRRFLSEYLHEPADVLALSLGAEYAVTLASEAALLFRRLVLIAPTGFSADQHDSVWQRVLMGVADASGAFELFYYRLTRRDNLRRFYERQVFLSSPVPDALIDYAYQTSHVKGAHHAPRRFIDGSLFLGEQARQAYERLRVPTLILYPKQSASLVQDFTYLPETVERNEAHLQAHALPGGLLPQWEVPEALFERIDPFLD